MHIFIGSVVMTFIFFCIKKAIGTYIRTMIYYFIVAILITLINLQLYNGEIDTFIVNYLLPIIIPLCINGIIYVKNRKDKESYYKNESIILFQLYKIIYLISTIFVLQILILLIVLKYVFLFPVNIVLIIGLGVGILFLTILTINSYRYKIEKIVILVGDEMIPYEIIIPKKTYIINRDEFINAAIDRAGIIFCNIKHHHHEIHYLYIMKTANTSVIFEDGNKSLYNYLKGIFTNNTFNSLSVLINETNIKIKYRLTTKINRKA